MRTFPCKRSSVFRHFKAQIKVFLLDGKVEDGRTRINRSSGRAKASFDPFKLRPK
jgi:hypothetical protein